MRPIRLSATLLIAALVTVSANAQQNSRAQLRIYNEQAGPRNAVRDWRDYRRYDYDRYEKGQAGYYADRYYRDGRYYRAYALTRSDRVYRGGDRRYYCRRADGTTGLLDNFSGFARGDVLVPGRSRMLGDLVEGSNETRLAARIDGQKVMCR